MNRRLWLLLTLEAVVVLLVAPTVLAQEATYVDASVYPETVSAKGEIVRFLVDVVVPVVDLPATITALTSDLHGDIADPGNPSIVSTNCAVPVEYVATGGNYGMACSFEALIEGAPGNVTTTISANVLLSDGSEVTVTDSAVVTISVELGEIQGKLVDADTGLPIQGIYVWGSCFDCGGFTDPDGTFLFEGVEPGTYRLHSGSASPGGKAPTPPEGYRTEYAYEWYDLEPVGTAIDQGTPVTVLAGETTEIQWELSVGGAIEGTVTEAITGEPFTGFQIWYWITEAGSSSPWEVGGYWDVEAGGNYRVYGLRAGDYIVCFESGPYASECWDAIPRTTIPPDRGNLVSVALRQTTTGINAEIDTGAEAEIDTGAEDGNDTGAEAEIDTGAEDGNGNGDGGHGGDSVLPFTGGYATPVLALTATALVVVGAVLLRASERPNGG